MTVRIIDGPELCPAHGRVGELLTPEAVTEAGRILSWTCPARGTRYARSQATGRLVEVKLRGQRR